MLLVPFSVLHLLEIMRAKFFLGYDPDERRLHWVRWETVLIAKVEGGLGVGFFFL